MNQISKRLIIALSILCAFSITASEPQPRNYTIPTLDLSDQTHRQVIVDREKGQYLGHPTTVLLEDGKTMLIVYPKGHGRGGIVYKRSTDGGRTWSERLPTPKAGPPVARCQQFIASSMQMVRNDSSCGVAFIQHVLLSARTMA